MFGDIGPGELILILVVLVVVFGPKRIPELAGSLGKGIRQFKRSMQGLDEEPSVDTTSAPQPVAQIAPPPPLAGEPTQEPADTAEPVHAPVESSTPPSESS